MASRTPAGDWTGPVNEGSDMELGGKFWLRIHRRGDRVRLRGILLFLLIGNAWARWGFLGMFLFLSAVLLAIGWIIDRRTKRRYDSLGDAG